MVSILFKTFIGEKNFESQVSYSLQVCDPNPKSKKTLFNLPTTYIQNQLCKNANKIATPKKLKVEIIGTNSV